MYSRAIEIVLYQQLSTSNLLLSSISDAFVIGAELSFTRKQTSCCTLVLAAKLFRPKSGLRSLSGLTSENRWCEFGWNSFQTESNGAAIPVVVIVFRFRIRTSEFLSSSQWLFIASDSGVQSDSVNEAAANFVIWTPLPGSGDEYPELGVYPILTSW